MTIFGINKSDLETSSYLLLGTRSNKYALEKRAGRKAIAWNSKSSLQSVGECKLPLIASRICQTQSFVLKAVFPFVVQYALKAVNFKNFGKTICVWPL